MAYKQIISKTIPSVVSVNFSLVINPMLSSTCSLRLSISHFRSRLYFALQFLLKDLIRSFFAFLIIVINIALLYTVILKELTILFYKPLGEVCGDKP